MIWRAYTSDNNGIIVSIYRR